ncbi:hypothetical protein P692DRAFT_20154244 [Suillus brevipes Sb2]|nr:hypothetical protein P692DRAFT_20154244 [Suillus brevipes Sb2]
MCISAFHTFSVAITRGVEFDLKRSPGRCSGTKSWCCASHAPVIPSTSIPRVPEQVCTPPWTCSFPRTTAHAQPPYCISRCTNEAWIADDSVTDLLHLLFYPESNQPNRMLLQRLRNYSTYNWEHVRA